MWKHPIMMRMNKIETTTQNTKFFFTNAALIVTIVAVVVTYDSKSLVDLMVIWLD